MTCKDCIHHEMIKYFVLCLRCSNEKNIEQICPAFKDKSRYIKLPTAYKPRCYIEKDEATKRIWVVKDVNYTEKWLVQTPEEAESKLKEIQNE